ncbi:HpcH/HpaI aldolase family protein [Ferribacterium limneticum]|uniref:HpcH/HpaI aldolase family protein n=1 Tax=Ferribacterium limneticum TaxID=76259 RepID=UPI001CFAF4A6|nr:aldolase/citrate lyase family protein [Ferribacterium limneticum]UCV17765.1 2-dehydro-3-deoxyglucarate aldolase [Ferribacterium limneticum]
MNTTTPVNSFKQALREKRAQIGFWLTLGDSTSAEICASAGFDWLLIDGEHVPHSLQSVLDQLRSIAGYPETHAIARVPSSDPILIKQYLDLGVQTLLVPMVESADEAASIVKACRYPPSGSRGIGGARAARWGHFPKYLHEADDQIAVIVQVESQQGLDNLDEIVQTEGIDGVFIGPADLSASLGYLGQPGHPEVQRQIREAVDRISAAGKAPGILTRDLGLARAYLERGVLMLAVGLDAHLLAAETRGLVNSFKANG